MDFSDFSGTVFAGDVRFDSVTFEKGTSFANSIFGSRSNFNSSIIKVSSNFSSTKFTEFAEFRAIYFAGSADFSSAIIRDSIDFSSSIFAESAKFAGMIFIGSVSFNSTVFVDEIPQFTTNSDNINEAVAHFSHANNPESYAFNVLPQSNNQIETEQIIAPDGRVFTVPKGCLLFDPESQLVSTLEEEE